MSNVADSGLQAPSWLPTRRCSLFRPPCLSNVYFIKLQRKVAILAWSLRLSAPFAESDSLRWLALLTNPAILL